MKQFLLFMAMMPFCAMATSITGIKADGNTKVFNLDEVSSIKVDGESTLAVNTRSGDVNGGYQVIKFSETNSNVEASKSNYEIKVYPNPVKNILYLVGADADTKFEVVSVMGQSVIKGKGESVNVSNLSSGQYIIKVDNKSVKFIKE